MCSSKVLKYAAKHKYPVQRSAFTYCENERPTRLDYGKSKYGGPFTTEQVEDVKTFWRILVVIIITSVLGIPHQYYDYFSSFRSSIQEIILGPNLFIIPLYELLIYPCLRNRGPSIFQSAGIGAAVLIASSLYGMIGETLENCFNGTSQCATTQNSHGVSEIIIGYPINILLGFTLIVLPKSAIEFICAQAPYNMKGIFIGLSYAVSDIICVIGTLLYFAWNKEIFSCGIWFYLSTLVLAVVSSALLGLVIRWYKARERDEITRSQDLVEEVYHKYQEQTKHSDTV